MDYSLILKRSWDYMWRYKALWLFGTLLALTTVNGLYFFPGDTRYEISEDELAFRLSEDDTLTFPGESLKIGPQGHGQPDLHRPTAPLRGA